MRNLKRALSLAMAAAMLLGMMVIGAGAASYNDFTDKDEITHKEAVALLVDLGIVDGKTATTYDPKGTLERVAISKLVFKLMMGPTADESAFRGVNTGLTDVAGNWGEGFINYCVSNNIIAGVGDNKFNPSGDLTVAAAAKTLLVTLGYDPEASGYVGNMWTINVMRDAQIAGLTAGIDQGTNDAITRDNAAQMLYNALFAGTVTPSYQYDQGVKYLDEYKPTGTTLGKLNYKLGKVVGVVTKNESAALAATDSVVGAGFTTKLSTIGGNDYAISTDMSMLGKEVVFYVKLKDVSAAVTSSNIASIYSSEVVTTANNTVSTVATTGTKSISKYGTDNYSTSTIIYNTLGATKASLGAALASGASIDYIDNNADGKIEYALISNYSFGRVTAKTTAGNGTIAVDSLPGAWTSLNTIGFANVEKGDYVLGTNIGGKLYLEKAEPFSGEMTAYNASKRTIVIDGTTYVYLPGITANGTTDMATVATGTTYLKTTNRYFLNKAGAVIACIPGDGVTASANYAAVVSYQYYAFSAMTGPANAKAYVVLPDGTNGVYDVAADATGVVPNQGTDFTGVSLTAPALVSYSINGAGEISLTKLTAGADGKNTVVGAQNAAVWKGQRQLTRDVNSGYAGSAKIADIYLDSTTSFVFISAEGKVTSFQGVANVPTMSAVKSTLVIKGTSSNIASLVVIADAAPADVSNGSLAYSLSAVADVTSEGSKYPFIVNGEVVYLTLGSAPTAGNTYTYVTNETTGVSIVTAQASATGIVKAYTAGDFALIDSAALNVADDMQVYTFTGNAVAGFTVAATSLAVNQQVTYVLNSAGKVATVYVLVEDATAALMTGVTTEADVSVVISAATGTPATATITLSGNDKAAINPFAGGNATLVLSAGATFAVGGKASGNLENDDVITVTAADGTTTTAYTVIIPA